MQLPRPIETACIATLKSIFSESQHADKAIEHAMRTHRKWGARDRRVFAETVYDIVRWRRLIETLAQTRDEAALILFYVREKELFREKVENLPLAVRESVPDWLASRLTQELGLSGAAEMMRALNKPAPHFLRVNELKTSVEKARELLSKEGVETQFVDQVPSALRLLKRQNVFRTTAFQNGWIEMQDAGSQMVGPFLNPEPGEVVIDACAGAGGKSLHLASLMKNKGRLLCLDVNEWKLDELKKRARRAGVSNIETRLIDSTKVIKRLEGSADRVLLDVPCSGLGVLRRNPDAKWKLNEVELNRLAEIQTDVLQSYSRMVRPGGHLVYSTCSVLPSENWLRVQDFTDRAQGEFRVETQWQVSPIETQFDGFFASRMVRGLN